MSHTTTRAGFRWRSARIALATVVSLMAMGAAAGAAQATGGSSDNDEGFANLTISKQTDPVGDPTVFTFKVEFAPHAGDSGVTDSNEVAAPETFTLTGGQTIDFGQIHKGFYTVKEQTQSGWELVDIQCTPPDPDPADAYQIDLSLGSVVVELSNGESKHCTFVNRKAATPVTPLPPDETVSGSQAATSTPGIAVLPVTVRPGAAQLAAPARCVSRRYSVAVRGSRVKSVSWYVNGRYIKRTTARNSRQRLFTTSFLPGAHMTRVQARVTFASNTTPATRTLNTTIRRCSPAVVRPQFTG